MRARAWGWLGYRSMSSGGWTAVFGRFAAAGSALAIGTMGEGARAATVNWISDVDGSWATAANWSSSPAVPGVNDDVVIGRLGADPLVSVLASFGVRSLVLDNRLRIAGGARLTAMAGVTNNGLLSLEGTASGNADFDLDGAGQTL